MSMEVESGDVIRLILQFLKENNLSASMKTLQEESKISFNSVESIEQFHRDVVNGECQMP